MGKRKLWKYSRRVGQVLAGCYLFQQIGCLPDQAFQQVVAENVVLTAAIIIQSTTALIFNTIFGLFPEVGVI
jgi:predicted permease